MTTGISQASLSAVLKMVSARKIPSMFTYSDTAC